MNYHIDIQNVCDEEFPITDEILKQWVHAALLPHCDSAELTLRFVNTEEITTLNRLYRKKDKATNVLAFPASLPENIVLEYPLLGDVVICPTILKQESQTLEKTIVAHWAHIIIHGVLHLLGYDHIKKDDLEKMQALEIQLLKHFGFDNPYISEAN